VQPSLRDASDSYLTVGESNESGISRTRFMLSLGNLGVLSSQEKEMAKKRTSETDEQSLIAAANEGVKALQLLFGISDGSECEGVAAAQEGCRGGSAPAEEIRPP